MCRLFGLLAGPATPAEPWLISTDRSLLAQAHASAATAQDDGWGIAWYPGTRTPHLEQGPGGAYQPGEKERFQAAARRAVGPVVIGHLRNASNPMDLPKARLLGLENVQPYTSEGILFAHNGCINFPRETRPLLGKFEDRVKGVNDSEVLFWLLVKHTETLGDPLIAFGQTIRDLIEVWRGQGRPAGGPYSGLNVLFSRGPNELWAFCHWNGDHGASFFDPLRPYYQMAYSADAKRVVVGSEPFDASRGDWRNLTNGQYLHAQLAHGLVALKTGILPPFEAPPTVTAGR